MTTIEKNLIIWKALNMLDSQKYPEAINDGQGMASSSYSSIYEFGREWIFSYFHNSWNDLIPAILLVKGKYEVVDFDSSYNDLFISCKQLTESLPKTVWFLENDNKEMIVENYIDLYDKYIATENDKIPVTTDQTKAISFKTKLEASKFINTSFQARHVNNKGEYHFKPVEHEILNNR